MKNYLLLVHVYFELEAIIIAVFLKTVAKLIYGVSLKSLCNFKKLLQYQMMRQCNESCLMLISIS